jgi:hypothetical protein
MAAIVDKLRGRTGQPLQTIYSDLASNNFNKGDPTKAGYDLGFQLWDVDKRRQPPPPRPKDDDEADSEGRNDPAKQ